MTVYIVKIKIHENITEEFSYVEPKSYDMPGKNVVIPENWRYYMSGKIFAFQEKLRYVLHCNLRLGTFRNSLLRRGLHEVSSEGNVSAQGVMGRAK